MLDLWFVYGIPFVFFIVFLTKWFFTAPTHKNSPPSPPTFPIIGNLHQVGLYPHRSLQKLAHQYGPLMLLHFGSRPVLIVSSSDAAREIMKTHDLIFLNRPKFSAGHRLLYNGRDMTASPYGEFWRKLRSLCTLQLLSNKRVQSFRGVREEEVALLVDNIKRCNSLSSSSEPVNLSDMFALLANDVICRVAFGKKYSEDEKGKRFKELISKFMELLGGFRVGDYIPWLDWVHYVNGFDAQVDNLAKEFDIFLDGVVEEHENAFINIKEKIYDQDGGEDRKDFVDVLLEIQSEEMAGYHELDRESIKALILDMYIAGTDTTYTVLEWAMAELLRYPRVMKKLQDEVREIGKGKTYITENDLDKMHYLKAVIKETLRLYPPLPLLLARESAEEVNIKGYDIAAETMVITNGWAIGRDPKLWDKPEEFQPERFSDSEIDFRGQHFEFIPFSAGRRGCPGASFAMVIDELSLANVVYKFDWSLPDGVTAQDLDMTECIGFIIHRKVPLLAVATPR